MMVLSIVLAFFLVISIVAFLYKKLISINNQVDKAFICVDVILKRRCELIPELISSVQQYMQYEKSKLIELTRLRSKALSGELSNDQRVEVENQITRDINTVVKLTDNYPALQADQDFLHIRSDLNEIEEQIAAARKFYNSAVTEYNNNVKMLPTNILASVMNYRFKKLFEVERQERGSGNTRRLV